MKPKLVFVYNADSGMFNTITDIAHKILSPDTYDCKLCMLTHSYFKIKQDWVDFLKDIDADCEFLHRDELSEKYGLKNIELPVILLHQGQELSSWITRDEILQCESIEALKTRINTGLADLH
ncbi:MAG: hypothetical protein OEZ39_12885 [Gammaproteobacteria bacterium]|nr:hypothetical protein [Gammaproteobacteria bacterium]MDH5652743.1 hypothetical protein [Gammaproteobacteria bacterium]